MKSTPENIALLEKLGFECKPWEGYPKTWWFDGEPVFTDLNTIKDFPSLMRICFITYADVGQEFRDHRRDNKAILNAMLGKVIAEQG